jgi:N-acyl homoserine lactone hydrolase
MIEAILTGQTFATASGNLTTGTVTLLEHPDGPVLVDVAAWNQRQALLDQLAARGLRPDSIAQVILTHAHWDHCMNFELFPHARFLLPEAEWHRLRQGPGDPATPSYLAELLQARCRLEFFGEGELMRGVRAVATPGHTTGHMSLLVDCDGSTVAISGDALATRADAQAGRPSVVFSDARAAAASVRRLLADADIIVPGHDLPFHSAEPHGAVVAMGRP